MQCTECGHYRFEDGLEAGPIGPMGTPEPKGPARDETDVLINVLDVFNIASLIAIGVFCLRSFMRYEITSGE
jgi:hypothetical protein